MDEAARGMTFQLGFFWVVLGTLTYGRATVLGLVSGALGGLIMAHSMYEWWYWREQWGILNASFARALAAKEPK